MYLLLFVLHDPSKLEDLLDAWETEGVQRVTLLFSTGLGRLRHVKGLRDDLPLIPSLEDFYQHEDRFSRTLFTVISDMNMVQKLLRATTAVVGDLSQPNTGLMLVLPLVQAFGLEKVQE